VPASKTNSDSIILQDRDFALLRGLFESRVMTASHIATQFFDEKAEMAKKRLQKLKATGYVRERPRRPSDSAVLFLTRKALEVLHDRKRHLWHRLTGMEWQVAEVSEQYALTFMLPFERGDGTWPKPRA
jgi:hypothetical protein